MATCLDGLTHGLEALRAEFGLSAGEAAVERARTLGERLGARSIDDVIDDGLHEVLDAIQRELYGLSDVLYREFFGVGA